MKLDDFWKKKRQKIYKSFRYQFIEADSGQVFNTTINDRAVQGIEETIITNVDKLLNLASNDYLATNEDGSCLVSTKDNLSYIGQETYLSIPFTILAGTISFSKNGGAYKARYF